MENAIGNSAKDYCTSQPPVNNMSLLSMTVLAVLVVWIVHRIRKLGSREQGLPPGPPTLPLIGNLHVYPTTHAHLKYVSISMFTCRETDI